MKFKRITIFFVLFFLSSILSHSQGPSNCGCDTKFDFETEPDELEDCLELCNGADVPVSNNIWLLLTAGTLLFVFKRFTVSDLRNTIPVSSGKRDKY